jgi:multidrug efflux system outer membrane protein
VHRYARQDFKYECEQNANLLSADENRKVVLTTLVSDVATAYFTVRELDYELEISKTTLATRRDSLNLTIDRQTGGVATDLDLRQAEQLVDTAAETIPTLQQQIEQTENQISLLLGENPGDVMDHQGAFNEDVFPPEVPGGLPSALLERRPDIGAAEQNLIAANADIGVAKAAYFPQLSLSGFIGGQSTQLSNLFSGPHSAWSFVPQLTQPIFTAGRLRSNVRLAEAQRDEKFKRQMGPRNASARPVRSSPSNAAAPRGPSAGCAYWRG